MMSSPLSSSEDSENGNNRDNNKSTQPCKYLLDIAINGSFKNENEGGAVDSKANNNGTANAVEAKVINGHAEQKDICQMMLPCI
ncbi:hypothetical protein MAM1_0051c03389 [Mucor ambiguus]|uniref:Uncharacterized protein n=1 Tax=Mucor ambiguus TaxID=91626 RepID=A0A0C9MPG7_9FUNG|nr:hypothetical protein MAM1_0051c03389 [Mucor ambiguus]